MRKDYEENVTTVFTTYFHLLGVSLQTSPDIGDYKIVTNHMASLLLHSKLRFLEMLDYQTTSQIIACKIHLRKESAVQTNCNFRPIIRPNSQPRGAHAEFVWRLRVWLLRATAKHPPTALSSVDDHFQALAGILSGWSPRSPPPQSQASWPAGRRQWWGWVCQQSSSPSVDPLLLHCPPIAFSQPWSFMRGEQDCLTWKPTCILACCPFFCPSLVRTDSTRVQTLRTEPLKCAMSKKKKKDRRLSSKPVRTL